MDIDDLARLAAKDRRARRGREPDYPKVIGFSLLIISGWGIAFEITLQVVSRWGP